MTDYLYPKAYAPSVYDIPYKYLREKGKRGLLFDIDNTLEPFDIARPSQSVKDLIDYVLSLGFKVMLISNNDEQRVATFADDLPVRGLAHARKPLPGRINDALFDMYLTPQETILVGDQLFTDVVCANLIGLFPILVKPLSDRDEWSVKPKRGLERQFVKRFVNQSQKVSLEKFTKAPIK